MSMPLIDAGVFVSVTKTKLITKNVESITTVSVKEIERYTELYLIYMVYIYIQVYIYINCIFIPIQ